MKEKHQRKPTDQGKEKNPEVNPTDSDGVKRPLAVERTTGVTELRKLQLLQRSVQNPAQDPHGTAAQRFTWR